MSSPWAFAICAALAIAATPKDDPGAARARAREVLKGSRCDKCHDSTVDASHGKALAVYDLASAGWPETMTDAQLPKLLSRLRGAPPADQQAVRELVAIELRNRAAQRR